MQQEIARLGSDEKGIQVGNGGLDVRKQVRQPVELRFAREIKLHRKIWS